MPDEYPQVRISPEAHAHLLKVAPLYRKTRGHRVPLTTIASEAILSIPLPKKDNGGKKSRTEAGVDTSAEVKA